MGVLILFPLILEHERFLARYMDTISVMTPKQIFVSLILVLPAERSDINWNQTEHGILRECQWFSS